MNLKIRRKYITYRRSNFTWNSSLFAILANSGFLVWYALSQEILKGFAIYFGVLMFEFMISKVIYTLLYGLTLEEGYQWGNPDFENYEGNYMDKLYLKGRISDNEFDDYFYENNRVSSREDVEDCIAYFSQENICIVVLNLVYGVIGVILFLLVLR